MIAIIDYGLGNVRAFANIYRSVDVPFVVATRGEDLAGASRAILPGVGAFDQAMHRLEDSGMRARLDELVLERGMPVLGVCVGMQILVHSSEEGAARGLGWIDGEVVRFSGASDGEPVRVPHMGWNDVQAARAHPLLGGLDEGARFYFLHSFHTRCRNADDVLATTRYGGDFVCAVNRGNIHGVQFHPEKSHRWGIDLLRNFAGLPDAAT